MEDQPLCVIMTATATLEDAQKIAQVLVNQNLAACVQRLPITSHYTWQGQIHEETEYLLLIKTRPFLYPEVKQTILQNHPYQVPEIIQLPITQGLPAYLAWAQTSTKTG